MCFKRGCHTAVIDWGGCQKICISQQDPVKRVGGGEMGKPPWTEQSPQRIFFSLMEVGLTVAVKRTASRTVSHERGVGLYRITLQQHAHWFREEKTAQSAPGRGGGGRGLPRGGRRGEIQERKRAWEGKRKKRRKKKEGAPQSMWREEMRWNTEPEQMW